MAKIDSPTQRAKLPIRREPYWKKLRKGGYVGFRRGAETWIARWLREEDKKQEYQALKLPQMEPADEFNAAVKWATAWLDDKEQGVIGRWRVEDAAKHYVADRRVNKNQRAADKAERRIKYCILPTLGRIYLDRIKTADIEAWFHSLIPADVIDEDRIRAAKATANRDLTTLKAMLNAAWRSGRVVSTNAWKKVSAFKGTRNARKVFLTPEQRLRLLDNCNGGFRDLVEGALLFGPRYGEMGPLLAGDYDHPRRTLSIRKGKTGPRDIPVNEDAAKLLLRLKTNKLPGAPLFQKDDGTAWGTQDQARPMREAGD